MKKWRNLLAPRFLARNDSATLFDDAKLESAGKWVAVGFATLSALLSFLGIREGVLDSLLRSAPSAALFVFALLGAGLLCGLLAPALLPAKRIYLGWPLVALGVVLVLAETAFPDLGEPAITLRQKVLGGAFCLVTILLFRTPVSLIAALLSFGVALTATGLYGAAQLSVGSKLFTGEPQVKATLEEKGEVDAVSISVSLSRAKENDKWSMTLAGATTSNSVATAPTVLGHAVLTPDLVGDINTALLFPVNSANWLTFSVRVCPGKAVCGSETEKVRLTGGLRAATPTASGHFSRAADGSITGMVEVIAMQTNVRGQVIVQQVSPTPMKIRAKATILPKPDGAGSLSVLLPNGKAGDTFELLYRTCSGTCDLANKDSAGYVVLASTTR